MENFILMFLCTGNICRSPMAEGIMKELVLDEFTTKHQVLPIEIISAGTFAVDGMPASGFAIDIVAQHGINLNFHRSRQITEEIAKSADLILTMEKMHTDYIKEWWPYIDYVYELKSFDCDVDPIGDSIEIRDPIGMDIDFYINVFEELQREIVRVSKTVFSLTLEKHHAN